MNRISLTLSILILSCGLVAQESPVTAGAGRVEISHEFVQTNLVSDIPGLAAITDSALVNPWGVSFSATSPFWVSNQGTNTTTLYAVTGSTTVSKVDINPPTGLVLIPTTTAQ